MTDIKDIYDRLNSLEADSARADQHVQDLEKNADYFTVILCSKIDKLQKAVETRFLWVPGIIGLIIGFTLSFVSIIIVWLVTGK